MKVIGGGEDVLLLPERGFHTRPPQARQDAPLPVRLPVWR